MKDKYNPKCAKIINKKPLASAHLKTVKKINNKGGTRRPFAEQTTMSLMGKCFDTKPKFWGDITFRQMWNTIV